MVLRDEAGDLVQLLGHGDALDDVAELHDARHLGEDGHRERIPLGQQLALLHLLAVGEVQLGAVGQAVALALAAGVVLDDDLAVPVHDGVVLLALDQLDVLQLDVTVVAGLEL